MESRKTLFLFSLLDFLLIHQILKDLYLSNEGEINLIRNFCFIFIWIFLSYLNGRYSYFRNVQEKGNKIYKLFISTLLVILLTYGFDKTLIIFFSNWIPLDRNNLAKIMLYSFAIQLLKFLIKNPLEVKEYVFLVGRDNKIKNFYKYCNFHLKNRKLIIKNFT